MEIEGIEMSDLVQKIADAVVPMLWIGDDEADSRARVESAIRQALADAGGAVAYIDEAGTLYPCAESIKNYLPKGRTATPLHTHPAHPDSGRVAELEAQLAAVTRDRDIFVESFNERTDRIAALEQQLTESREQVWEFAERLTATRRALCDVRLKTREGSIVWKIADAALAADQEKNDE